MRIDDRRCDIFIEFRKHVFETHNLSDPLFLDICVARDIIRDQPLVDQVNVCG